MQNGKKTGEKVIKSGRRLGVNVAEMQGITGNTGIIKLDFTARRKETKCQ